VQAAPDPFAGAEDRGPGGEPTQQTTRKRALLEGALDTASFGFRDEMKAASEASGLPSWLGGYRAPIGAAKIGLEKARGEHGEASQTYDRELEASRKLREKSKEEHPAEFMTGQVGGALLSPGLGAGAEASLGIRAARAAGAGALQGGAYGFGSGQGGFEPRLKSGAIGGGIGAAAGGVLSPVTDIAAAGAGKAADVGKTVFNTIRHEFNPQKTIENVAANKVVGAHLADLEARGGAPALTPEEHQIAAQVGIPLTPADIGGERTLAAARSAADVSPEARAELTDVAKERFAGQSRRIGGFIKDLTGGANTTVDDLQAAARRANRPAYARAYGKGSGEITSPVLDELSQAPAVQAAMRDAAVSGKNRAAAEGMGAFDPSKRNMQFWDYTYRNVRDAASEAARQGRGDAASSLGGIANRMRDELDQHVPEFKQAREGAAGFFGAQDALEAGQKFVDAKGKNADYARAIGKMSDPEKQLFAQGFASHLSDKILELRDSENVIGKAFLDAPAAKERIQMALGKDNAERLETLLRVEGRADKLRQALGNSKTNQYQLANALTKLGAAGGGGLEAWEAAKEAYGEGGEGFDPTSGHFLRSMAAFGLLYGKGRSEVVNEAVARRVGGMLASEDPAVLRQAIDIVRKSPALLKNVRDLGLKGAQGIERGARRLGVRLPATQAPNVSNYPTGQ
jgi:hypothetical protein